MIQIFNVDVTTNLHWAVHHVYDQVVQLSFIRRESSAENEMLN